MGEFVLEVCGSVSIFGEVDVEAFGVFSIVVVRCSIKLDVFGKVFGKMDFGYVEVMLNPEADEDIFVVMEAVKGVVERVESGIGMNRVLHKKCEVEHSTDGADKLHGRNFAR